MDRMLILLRNYVPSLEVDTRLEKIITGKINADILIFGSSRGARNIIANEVSKNTGINCYNLSYPGSDITFHEFLLKQLLKNNNKKPEVVVLVVDDPSEILPNPSIKFRLDRLYPLVKYETIRDELIEKGEKNKYFSNVFILHQLSKSNFDIRRRNFSMKDTILICGSMPISNQEKGFIYGLEENSEYKIESEPKIKLASFLGFIELCRKNKIKLIITFPPNFKKPYYMFEKRIVALSKNSMVSYFHYDTTKSEYLNGEYFYDQSHLNLKGARLFTAELTNYLVEKNYINNIKIKKGEKK